MAKMEKAQPQIKDFIAILSENDEWTEGEHATTLMLMLMVYTMMSRSLPEAEHIPEVSGEMLRDALGINRIMLESFVKDEEDITSELMTMVGKYHQGPVLSFILLAILDDAGQEEPHIEQEMTLYIFIYLKTIIDCLDKA